MRKFAVLTLVFASQLALAEGPTCLPKEAGGAGTVVMQRSISYGKVPIRSSEDLIANGGVDTEGGYATWWWCPIGKDWKLEWYAWQFRQDQIFGGVGFDHRNPLSIEMAYSALRNPTSDKSEFAFNVIKLASTSKPK